MMRAAAPVPGGGEPQCRHGEKLMRSRLALVVLLGLALLAGCAAKSQRRLNMMDGALGAGAGRILVAMTDVPPVDTRFPGAECLECGSVPAANASLTHHVRALPREGVAELKDRAAELVQARGATPLVLIEALQTKSFPDIPGPARHMAPKDFRGLRDKLNVDKLLLIQVDALGVHRNYSRSANAEPKAVFEGHVLLVNLHTNQLEWYHTIKIAKAAEGAWAEPPKFPRLTKAYLQALELGKEEVLRLLR
ncbi:hypothetical protein ACS5PN_15395 [Roseateles sp. NT4]|uniref:hypothetical protein n=1 Tax=Roseateles sp. NT4 TaxID=3453715 RepID=UPI003EE9AABE